MRKHTNGIDYTSRDYQAFREMMIEHLASKMPEYDTSQTDAGIVLLESTAKACDILSMYNDIVANDTILETTQDRSIAVIISRMLGHIPSNTTASKLKQLFILSQEQEQDKIISRGTVVYTPTTSDEESVYFETLEDLVIPKGCLGDEKDENGEYKYLVTIAQGKSVKEDVLGSSDGLTAYQEFICSYQHVIADSLEVYVNEGNGYVMWKRVDSFIDSDSNSRHYTIFVDEFDRCTITFGNGVMGHIPLAYEGGIIADYRVGGGKVGNVRANTITELQSGISFIESTTNPYEPFEFGDEKESLEEIKELAPKAFKTQNRAVAKGDFADLIRLGFNKYFRYTTDVTNVGDLTVHTYYLMRDGYKMTDALKEEIKEYMSPKKVVGSTIELHEYIPKVINVDATLKVFKDYEQSLIHSLVESAVRSYFDLGEFNFGDELILSDLEGEIVDGIDGVRSFRINLPSTDITPLENEIIVLGDLTIEVSGGII